MVVLQVIAICYVQSKTDEGIQYTIPQDYLADIRFKRCSQSFLRYATPKFLLHALLVGGGISSLILITYRLWSHIAICFFSASHFNGQSLGAIAP